MFFSAIDDRDALRKAFSGQCGPMGGSPAYPRALICLDEEDGRYEIRDLGEIVPPVEIPEEPGGRDGVTDLFRPHVDLSDGERLVAVA